MYSFFIHKIIQIVKKWYCSIFYGEECAKTTKIIVFKLLSINCDKFILYFGFIAQCVIYWSRDRFDYAKLTVTESLYQLRNAWGKLIRISRERSYQIQPTDWKYSLIIKKKILYNLITFAIKSLFKWMNKSKKQEKKMYFSRLLRIRNWKLFFTHSIFW
jgi:hypothetical protein